jgi:hypothetical protein
MARRFHAEGDGWRAALVADVLGPAGRRPSDMLHRRFRSFARKRSYGA